MVPNTTYTHLEKGVFCLQNKKKLGRILADKCKVWSQSVDFDVVGIGCPDIWIMKLSVVWEITDVSDLHSAYEFCL